MPLSREGQLTKRRIGLVEDDAIMGESLVHRLELEGGEVFWWRDGASAVAQMSRAKPDIVICDIRLPDMSGEDVFRSAAGNASPPFLFITAYGEIDQAVRLMRAGAGDYVTKPFDMSSFLSRIEGLLRPSEELASGVLGISPVMLRVETLLRRLADRSPPILITGETGVGKEVCARFLHEVSSAASQPFMAVNCAAIPGDLLESEIFGHEKGAFSGAANRHLGYAERAGKGILFLDEIGELPLTLQGKLLRLLAERTFFRVGGEQAIPFKARVVTATNRDLPAAIRDGQFREDLYYRINVVALDIPPLRERPEDIPCLLERLFDALSEEADSPLRGISSLAEEAALAHAWPGNVRELRNRVERAVALAAGDWIMPGDLFPELGMADMAHSIEVAPLSVTRESAERRAIQHALDRTSGQVIAAAHLLQVSRTTLWDKMRRLGLTGGE
ncbi:sigma-54 dependent transcriptional regulator [Aurantimonas sp. C2-6-R+9]|uniref:sigma-54-dependent transcriptional regulator n=1 Tax=unclassified Aurantimonas TaxID=2638230 RepID=UPI002E19AC85|nr:MULTISPECIES: sigma-54 dependent transcriptional regulator [unclassified Aurantimonas]MEC5292884.1 sigma-54 dependent transcriptional regulator [Aurantimonas sp. C2-3-R2]MEC5383111.1 sigma-54 dependent transcriptional regulator [Aurantimonas sp. C2-6-R+9]MEC5413934.1 sigma-54 dependent transcriptional regulator [Aurantimonas sp. C2-4-R8]